MSNYPTAIDGPSTLYVPVNKTSAASLETTLTAGCLSGDTTIQVADAIGPGFPSAYGVIRIGDETIIYTGRTATTFTGCQRGASGSAAAHSSGAAVRGLTDALFLLALQSAVAAIQNAVGTAGAFNFAAVAHSHAASDVTSGTMDVARLPLMGVASSGTGGAAGLVPASAAGDQAKYLRADRTWQTVSGGSTTAASVSFTPAGTIAATDVQAAIEEVNAEKAGVSHTHAAADVTSGTFAVARIPVMTAASPGAGGTGGAVPASAAGDQDKFLRADATWAALSSAGLVPDTRQIIAGAGMSGGGDLSADRTLTADVRTVHGRTGNVVAAAGDYNAPQIDISAAGMPGWMSSPSTVKQAIDAIISKISSLESGLSAYLTTSTAASTYCTISTFNAHSHNLNVYADGGHDHSGTVTPQADHIHNGNTGTPV